MRQISVVFNLATIVVPSVAVQAQSPTAATIPLAQFEGTWLIDTSQDEYGGRPVSRLIRKGVYRCGNCVTKVEVPADGRFHSFAGGQDFDEVAVLVRGPRQVDFQYRKAGRLAETVTERVSARGEMLFYRNVNFTASNGKPTVVEGQRSRVGVQPPGAHPVSGEWRQLGGSKESAEALTLRIRTSGDQVTIMQPTGRQVSARIGGSAMPVAGDQAGRMVRIDASPPHSLRTTMTIAGKDVQTGLITVAPDGRSLTFEVRDLGLGQSIRSSRLSSKNNPAPFSIYGSICEADIVTIDWF